MLYLKPTKRGLGVTLWGPYDDLKFLYDVLYELSPDSDTDTVARKHHDQTNLFILDFSYSVRKAYEGSRLKRKVSHFSYDETIHYGVCVSWVQMLFWLGSLRHNLRFIPSDKFVLSIIFNLEYWLERVLEQYEPVYGKRLFPYINGSIYTANPYLLQYGNLIENKFLELGGGKKAFRELPELMRASIFGTKEYKILLTRLEEDAKTLQCKIEEIVYQWKEEIKW